MASSKEKKDAGVLWEENAEAWSELARMGYDIYRDGVNSPTFIAQFPSVRGLVGLDVGCGEGDNTRRVARLGAKMFAVDISKTFIRYARQHEDASPLGIQYEMSCGSQMAFPDEQFDFVISTMALMDMKDLE
ncbi:MAG: class I SAM-dependent methyltransferase [Candidatus Obscuribacterales bacterium]|nr:class I SAM-dependent methyltransferase [Candidatus Obscuribacterales bacterium]